MKSYENVTGVTRYEACVAATKTMSCVPWHEADPEKQKFFYHPWQPAGERKTCDMSSCLHKHQFDPEMAPLIKLNCKLIKPDESDAFWVHPECYNGWARGIGRAFLCPNKSCEMP